MANPLMKRLQHELVNRVMGRGPKKKKSVGAAAEQIKQKAVSIHQIKEEQRMLKHPEMFERADIRKIATMGRDALKGARYEVVDQILLELMQRFANGKIKQKDFEKYLTRLIKLAEKMPKDKINYRLITNLKKIRVNPEQETKAAMKKMQEIEQQQQMQAAMAQQQSQ